LANRSGIIDRSRAYSMTIRPNAKRNKKFSG
jgi:hypothetical protein